MPSLTRPGVYVNQAAFFTQVASAPGNAEAAFVGAHPRGPLTPTVINNWAQFQSIYGGFQNGFPPSNLALAVYCFFATVSTASCVVVRVVNGTSGQTPATGTVSFNDTGGSPEPTLEISAANPGLWGNNIYIAIVPGTIVVGGVVQTFSIIVYYGGSTSANIVEQWNNLSMNPQSTNIGQGNYAPTAVNGNSNYIFLTNLNSLNPSPSSNPANTTVPAELTGGADGSVPSPTDNQTALALLDQFPNQNFLINLPGISDSTDLSNALTYVSGRGDSFLVIDTPSGMSPSSAVAFEQGLTPSQFQAVYSPWINIADPFSTVRGATRLVPPGGAVCGAIINTDTRRGVAKAPAGIGANLPIAQGLERTFTQADMGTLNQNNVNAIIATPNTGIIIWGARTTSALLSGLYINTQRSLSYIQANMVSLTQFAVFENNDFVLWTATAGILNQWLTSFWQSGGLAGQSPNDAFTITCDGTINTPAVIQAGQFLIEVGVALQYPAEFVVITLSQSQAGSSVTNSLTSIAA